MSTLTQDRPKCLVHVSGKALIEWQLEALRSAGISEIGIVTGYRREMLQPLGLTEFHNARWNKTQMVASLCYADPWLKRNNSIVTYSDIFFHYDIVRSLMSSDADIAVAYDPCWLELWNKRFEDPLVDAESFKVDFDGRLIEIGNKLTSTEGVHGQYMGLLKLTPKGWTEISHIRSNLKTPMRDTLQMTHLLQLVIQSGKIDVQAIPCTTTWGEIDSASDLSIYN